jgi:hypothetical protein
MGWTPFLFLAQANDASQPTALEYRRHSLNLRLCDAHFYHIGAATVTDGH